VPSQVRVRRNRLALWDSRVGKPNTTTLSQPIRGPSSYRVFPLQLNETRRKEICCYG
jgi:hypothetical protein